MLPHARLLVDFHEYTSQQKSNEVLNQLGTDPPLHINS